MKTNKALALIIFVTQLMLYLLLHMQARELDRRIDFLHRHLIELYKGEAAVYDSVLNHYDWHKKHMNGGDDE